MRRLALPLAVALALAVPAPGALGKGPAHPSRAYCKKHAKHLTHRQRAWCKRKKPATTAPASGPLTQPPAVDPSLGTTTAPAPTSTAGTTTSSAPTTAAARLAVGAKEFSLTLSRDTLSAGPAIVQLQNGGEDPHNLRIESLDGRSAPVDFPITSPGTVSQQRITLAAGSYRLYCTLSTHDAQGMHATLTVAP